MISQMFPLTVLQLASSSHLVPQFGSSDFPVVDLSLSLFLSSIYVYIYMCVCMCVRLRGILGSSCSVGLIDYRNGGYLKGIKRSVGVLCRSGILPVKQQFRY
ncbi:hypothetical protein QBC42DRAFT_260794 [Cladorrhinum samala]|uniref:Uncharacterized protein n=1 Tax=Cladorrhinum samala TaxID=585594 RepID=A0AAV9I1J8_9PEZI|nr:hypothetical protein QBC42DRAFT_260794 [Cladorrhinum samala]